MPELPEVESTRLGISPTTLGQTVTKVVVRDRRLRWPVTKGLEQALTGQVVRDLKRRAKYLLIDTDAGTLVLHLGMSGSLRVTTVDEPVKPHEHIDIQFDNDTVLRLRDPRRFGAALWVKGDVFQHPLLRHLGPEPLGNEFGGGHLHTASRKKKVAVKNFVMNAKIVVGVGNIYASESLFLAGIHPNRPAGRVSEARYQVLAEHIRSVLQNAIHSGGTTLGEYFNADGEPGRYGQRLLVYGREGEPCPTCQQPIKQKRIGQRSSFYCSSCQR